MPAHRYYELTYADRYAGSHLLELTSAEAKELEADIVARDTGADLRQVPASRAHQWVLSGRPHGTGLYVGDNGKIRWAAPGC